MKVYVNENVDLKYKSTIQVFFHNSICKFQMISRSTTEDFYVRYASWTKQMSWKETFCGIFSMYADQRRLEYPRYIERRNIHNLFCSNLDLYEDNQK
jgi:hypothetical protein